MKLLSNDNYKGLLRLIGQQKKEIEALRATIRQMKDDHVKELEAIALERDKLQTKLHYSELSNYYTTKAYQTALDISFPNTEERGSGDSDTPINLSDIFDS